jgi:hypothetical protein
MRSLDVADRLVRGVVAGAGTALYVGSGDWTVVRTATGVYEEEVEALYTGEALPEPEPVDTLVEYRDPEPEPDVGSEDG